MTRRRLLAVVVVVALAAGTAAVRTVLVDAAQRQDEAGVELAHQRSRHADAESSLRSVRADVDRIVRGLDEVVAARRAVLEETAAVQQAAGAVDHEVQAMSTQAADRAQRLEALRAQLGAVTAQADGLRACLYGVAVATTATHRGDTRAAVGALQAVDAVCRAAHSALGEIDPTVRFPYDFPDPFVVAAGDAYYAYATNSAGGHVQLLRSPDLRTWTFSGTALAEVPRWAVPGATWAPSVLPRPGGWRLYYTVREASSRRQCISVASAPGPGGPFVDTSSGPLVCAPGEGGAIDPSPYVGPGGDVYLLWKGEGETAGGRATIQVQPLSQDGLRVTQPPTVLLRQDQRWEGRTIEAPSMVATPTGLVLLYSANRWDSSSYAVGAARCDGPLGPCRKVGRVLSSFGPMVGPGGAEAFRDRSGQVQVAFHAWQGGAVGYPESRYLHIGSLSTADGRITISAG